MTAPIYNQKGTKTGTRKLASDIFEVEIKPWLVTEAVVAQKANARTPIAHAKGRSEVRGGGKKPWRQKGTGRARHGSIRSPLWRGGGATFGPTKHKNFSKGINKKVRRQALKMTLSDKAAGKGIKILDALTLSKPKTKTIAELLVALKIDNKKIILALPKRDNIILRSSRNIPKIKFSAANSLNPVDVLWADVLLTTDQGISVMEKTYGTS